MGREIHPVGDGKTVEEIAARIAAERASVLPAGRPHEAPESPLSVTESHRVMQRHMDCHLDECPRKAAAWRILVDAGRVTPDPRRSH